MKQFSSTLYVGFKVHKDFIAVAFAPELRGVEIISLGNIGRDAASVAAQASPAARG